MKWNVMIDGRFGGPYTEEEICTGLREHTMGPGMLVRRVHEERWTPASEIPAFTEALESRHEVSSIQSAEVQALNQASPTAASSQRSASAKSETGSEYQRSQVLKRTALLVTGLAALLGVFYVLAWPLLPQVRAERIHNPLGDDFGIASLRRSRIAAMTNARPSTAALCDVLRAWASAMEQTSTCSGVATFTAGSVTRNQGRRTDYLWGEIQGVVHGATTETACFVSMDDGRTWALDTGLAFFGIFPVQFVARTCRSFRHARYSHDREVTYEEQSGVVPIGYTDRQETEARAAEARAAQERREAEAREAEAREAEAREAEAREAEAREGAARAAAGVFAPSAPPLAPPLAPPPEPRGLLAELFRTISGGWRGSSGVCPSCDDRDSRRTARLLGNDCRLAFTSTNPQGTVGRVRKVSDQNSCCGVFHEMHPNLDYDYRADGFIGREFAIGLANVRDRSQVSSGRLQRVNENSFETIPSNSYWIPTMCRMRLTRAER